MKCHMSTHGVVTKFQMREVLWAEKAEDADYPFVK